MQPGSALPAVANGAWGRLDTETTRDLSFLVYKVKVLITWENTVGPNEMMP